MNPSEYRTFTLSPIRRRLSDLAVASSQAVLLMLIACGGMRSPIVSLSSTLVVVFVMVLGPRDYAASLLGEIGTNDFVSPRRGLGRSLLVLMAFFGPLLPAAVAVSWLRCRGWGGVLLLGMVAFGLMHLLRWISRRRAAAAESSDGNVPVAIDDSEPSGSALRE